MRTKPITLARCRAESAQTHHSSQPSAPWIRPAWLLLGFGALIATALAGCRHAAPAADGGKKGGPPKSAEPLRAAVATVESHTWPKIVRCQGSLVADDQTVIGSRVAGLVSKTLVDLGDAVEPGQTLVALDDQEFVLQLAAAEAGLLQARSLIGLRPEDPISKLDPLNAPPVREARATLDETKNRRERWEKLRNQNAVAEEELQTLLAAEKVAEARYASAVNGVNSNIALVAVRSAEVELAKQRIRDAHILAPFSGHVQQRFVAPGTFVQIGTPLVTIVRLDILRFRGTVPERLATELEVGQKVHMTIESVEAPIDAVVTRISPALDMASRSLAFEAVVENRNGALRAGLFAEAEVTIDPAAKAIVIDEASLVEFAGAQKVWKVIDGSAKEQKVEPGRRSNGLVEVVEGLKAGEQIIVNGALGRVAKVIPIESADAVSKTALTTAPAADNSKGESKQQNIAPTATAPGEPAPGQPAPAATAPAATATAAPSPATPAATSPAATPATNPPANPTALPAAGTRAQEDAQEDVQENPTAESQNAG
jgi:membrane fusion protein (multidrug efflux system)